MTMPERKARTIEAIEIWTTDAEENGVYRLRVSLSFLQEILAVLRADALPKCETCNFGVQVEIEDAERVWCNKGRGQRWLDDGCIHHSELESAR